MGPGILLTLLGKQAQGQGLSGHGAGLGLGDEESSRNCRLHPGSGKGLPASLEHLPRP